MKPMYSNHVRVGMRNRCRCCATRYSKSNNGTRTFGNKVARAHFKLEIRKEIA